MLRRIVVVLDGTGLAERALPDAMEVAKAVGGSLVLVRAADPRPHPHLLPGEHRDRRPVEDAEAYLEHLARQLEASGLATTRVLAHGQAPAALVTAIGHQQPDLVVVAGCRRPGLTGLLFREVTERIVATRVAPVLLVPGAAPDGPSRLSLHGTSVLVPLDGRALAEAALPTALELARALRGDIVLFQAVTEAQLPYAVPEDLKTRTDVDVQLESGSSYTARLAEVYLARMAKRLAREADGVCIDAQVRVGDIAQQLPLTQTGRACGDTSARGAGLIVMATHGRRGLSRWLQGSTTIDVVQSVDVPVVVVPAPAPATPSASPHPERCPGSA